MIRKTTLLVCTLVAATAVAQYKKPGAPAPTVVPGRSPMTVAPAAGAQAKMDSVRRITVADAAKRLKAGTAVIVDVRSNQQFQLGHIKGAVNIPGSQILARLAELPPKKLIITYCACTAEQSSGRAVLELNAHGVVNTAALKGGWDEWKQEGLPTARGRS